MRMHARHFSTLYHLSTLFGLAHVGACTSPEPSSNTAQAEPQVTVPARAPNFRPPTLDDDLVMDANGDQLSTSVLSVVFTLDASQAERQAAVDSVHGTVIGGLNPGGDGYYYVRVEGDGTLETIWAIAATLDELPQVELASPYTVWGNEY